MWRCWDERHPSERTTAASWRAALLLLLPPKTRQRKVQQQTEGRELYAAVAENRVGDEGDAVDPTTTAAADPRDRRSRRRWARNPPMGHKERLSIRRRLPLPQRRGRS